ncbi:OBAP family protein [Paramicrobacterium agarici]
MIDMAVNPLIPDRPSPTQPAGEGKGFELAILETGATALQSSTPLHGFDVYVVGFHPAKSDPHMQMEAHHYCRVVNDDLLQCTIFDGNTRDANLIGVEYIVSEKLFDTLPEEERGFWHPHNFEVLSGQLIAPGLPDAAEARFMQHLMNSYGKTWHTWHTGTQGNPGDELPLGEAKLMWSFNRIGECDPALHESREEAMKLDTAKTRSNRQQLVNFAHPQHGVDAIADAFTGTESITGVVDADSEKP